MKYYAEFPLLQLFYLIWLSSRFKAFCSESVVITTVHAIRKDYSKNKICEIVFSLNKKIIVLPCTARYLKDAAGKLPPGFKDALLYEIALHQQFFDANSFNT